MCLLCLNNAGCGSTRTRETGKNGSADFAQDIATQAGSNLTSLASDEPEGNVFVAGFGDGVVRLFDKRAADAGAVVMRTWRKHHTWIQSVHLQRGGQRELVTGRYVSPVKYFSLGQTDF